MAVFRRNKNLDNYKVVRSDNWVYSNPKGTYYTKFVIVEEKIIFEQAKGKPNLNDTKSALSVLNTIIKENFGVNKPHYVTDSRDIKGADAEVRKYIAEFHKNNHIFETISLIASPFTKALFSIVKSLGIGDFKKWKVYRNENYCIDEILDGQFIIGQSQESSDYELIYKALNDLNSNQFSLETLIKSSKTNEEFSSVIQAINIINEEHRGRKDFPDLVSSDSTLNSSSVLHKSIIENTESLVVLMDEEYKVVNMNDNFVLFFNGLKVKGKLLYELLPVEDYCKEEQKENHVKFLCNYKGRTLSCKLYKIESVENFSYVVFVGDDITEKENLKASEKRLLDELQQQNFKLLKVNHLLSHEVNHQIATFSQVLNEYGDALSGDLRVSRMISRIHQDLNESMNRMNKALYAGDVEGFVKSSNELSTPLLDEVEVFLIDDDEITNMLNEKVIRNNLSSCSLRIFTDGESSLKYMKNNGVPALIFLDMYMPEMNGIEFLERFKDLNFKGETNIFLLSSSRNPEEIKAAESYQEVKGYITKPLSNEKVKRILER